MELSATVKRRRGPRRALHVTIELPLPPVASVRSEEFNAWRQAAALKLEAQQVSLVDGCVAIRLRAGLVDSREMHAALMHAVAILAKHDVIESASSATDLSARWDRSVEPGRMVLDLRQTRAPEKRPCLQARLRASQQQSARWVHYRENRPIIA